MFSSGTAQQADATLYSDDVFSAYTYTGNGSTQTITNGIDLSGQGGLVWGKSRSGAYNHELVDTVRGAGNALRSNATAASTTLCNVTSFLSNGFTLDSGGGGEINANTVTQVGWTFRKAPKFFDVATFSTDGSGAATFSHSLGSTPGCIFIKRTGGVEAWYVYHRSLTNPNNYYLQLNATGAETNVGFSWITVSGTSCSINGLFAVSSTYVAYLFAHDTATDGIIQCGSFTTDGSGNATVTLGWEPQFVIAKNSGAVSEWKMLDTMRGWTATASGNALLRPNTSGAEVTGQPDLGYPTATGMDVKGLTASSTYIYLAIRRPNKPPTTGTQVYSGVLTTSSESAGTIKTTGFPIDLQIVGWRDTVIGKFVVDRLRGVNSLPSSYPSSAAGSLNTTATSAEDGGTNRSLGFSNTGFSIASAFELNNIVYWNFCRAPGVFDVVCYTGTGSATTVAHNLGVAPELMIVKSRSSAAYAWYVTGDAFAVTEDIVLNSTAAKLTNAANRWNSTRPTSSVFSIGTGVQTNTVNETYVWYGFATKAGISKVGSYTGNGSSQTINCGFTTGARFVLIKRTDSTGDWYTWDSTRGIVAGNDPHLSLNTTAAEVTTDDTIDPDTSGFIVNQLAATNVNVNTATYIFLALS